MRQEGWMAKSKRALALQRPVARQAFVAPKHRRNPRALYSVCGYRTWIGSRLRTYLELQWPAPPEAPGLQRRQILKPDFSPPPGPGRRRARYPVPRSRLAPPRTGLGRAFGPRRCQVDGHHSHLPPHCSKWDDSPPVWQWNDRSNCRRRPDRNDCWSSFVPNSKNLQTVRRELARPRSRRRPALRLGRRDRPGRHCPRWPRWPRWGG